MSAIKTIDDFQDLVNSATIYNNESLSEEEFNKQFCRLNKTGKEFIMFRNYRIGSFSYCSVRCGINNQNKIINLNTLKLRLFLEDGSIITKKCFIKSMHPKITEKFKKVKFYCRNVVNRFHYDDIEPIDGIWGKTSPVNNILGEKKSPVKKIEVTFKAGYMSTQFYKKYLDFINEHEDTVEDII